MNGLNITGVDAEQYLRQAMEADGASRVAVVEKFVNKCLNPKDRDVKLVLFSLYVRPDLGEFKVEEASVNRVLRDLQGPARALFAGAIGDIERIAREIVYQKSQQLFSSPESLFAYIERNEESVLELCAERPKIYYGLNNRLQLICKTEDMNRNLAPVAKQEKSLGFQLLERAIGPSKTEGERAQALYQRLWEGTHGALSDKALKKLARGDHYLTERESSRFWSTVNDRCVSSWTEDFEVEAYDVEGLQRLAKLLWSVYREKAASRSWSESSGYESCLALVLLHHIFYVGRLRNEPELRSEVLKSLLSSATFKEVDGFLKFMESPRFRIPGHITTFDRNEPKQAKGEFLLGMYRLVDRKSYLSYFEGKYPGEHGARIAVLHFLDALAAKDIAGMNLARNCLESYKTHHPFDRWRIREWIKDFLGPSELQTFQSSYDWE